MIDKFTLAEMAWGIHPMGWPRPPRLLPRWWQRKDRARLQSLEEIFGPLSQTDLDAYYREVRKGQSVYEDAGGYMLRCYQAMVGLPVDDPYTYRDAIAHLVQESPDAQS